MHIEVERTIKQYNMINEGDRIVAGVSGGADSVAMLLMLSEYRKKVNFDLRVFHLNHMIRVEAPADEFFVKTLCSRLDIPFTSKSEDVRGYATSRRLSTEEAGRIIRYREMRSMGADKIAVAHHRDDVAETVIFNMCRGTGIHGMVGIAPVQDDIIRPLIAIGRDDIEAYLKEQDQDYCTDSTNSLTDYTRNRIRLNVIPALSRELNGKASEHIAAMAGDMYEIECFINSAVNKAYLSYVEENFGNGYRVDMAAYRELDPYLFRELILKVLDGLTSGRKDVSRNHVDGITHICRTDGEKTLSLPYNVSVLKTYDSLIFNKAADAQVKAPDLFRIAFPGITMGEGWSAELPGDLLMTVRIKGYGPERIIPNKTYTKWFDYDKIDCSELCIRHREPGDYLTIDSSMSRKSLQDYMVDEKIEKHKREEILVMAQGSHVVWVIGYRISEYFKLSKDSTALMEVEITG